MSKVDTSATTQITPQKNALLKPKQGNEDHPDPVKKLKPNDTTPIDQLGQLLKWRSEIQVEGISTNPDEHKLVKTIDISSDDLAKHGQNLQALFINVEWKISGTSTGITIEELQRLNISEKLMNNGIIFIWSEKEILGELIDEMEKKGFQYIENFMITQISAEKALEKQRNSTNGSAANKEKKITDFFKRLAPVKNVWADVTAQQVITEDKFPFNSNVEEIFANADSPYFRKAKRVLLMFRKFNKEQQLELRHQRTSDIFFDIFSETDLNNMGTKGYELVYKMIETLLPKACYAQGQPLQMMEIYAKQSGQPRKGWISVFEESS